MTDRNESYNTYPEFPDISYNITKILLNNNQLIWKLLKYDDKNAWKQDSSHPDLTASEKGFLINNGDPDPEYQRFRVFFDLNQDDAWTSVATVLRIVPVELNPANYVTGRLSVAFQIFSHSKINTLSNYRTRTNVIAQQILETLNGQEVGGLGKLYFDSRASSACKMISIGQIPFKGTGLVMVNWM